MCYRMITIGVLVLLAGFQVRFWHLNWQNLKFYQEVVDGHNHPHAYGYNPWTSEFGSPSGNGEENGHGNHINGASTTSQYLHQSPR